MDNLFQPGWYGRYWAILMLHDRTLWIAIAVIILLAFLIMRSTRR